VRDVFIVGIGQTAVNRDASVRGRHLAAQSIRMALETAGAARSDINALYIGNMTAGMLGQQQQLGSLVADYAGLSGIEAVNIEAACASGAAATRMAYLTVAAGVHDVALVCGTERMTHADKPSVTRALATAADWELEGKFGESFLSLNARLMSQYMQKYDVRHEAFANFSINAHANAVGNPNALFRKEIDVDDYLGSRDVAEPLKLYDVSPICNGSAAVLRASGNVAKRYIGDRAAIRIAGSAAATAPVALSRRKDALHLEAVEIATESALRDAGISRNDIDLIELHDAYTIMTALCLESAGFAAPGTAVELAVENRIAFDADLPIATLGGLKARGHPVGATGVYQIVEAYLQLAGMAGPNQVPGAEIALTQNIGGTGSTVVNHILRRVN
jgi:acetyl-CoA C-acetyltransferase